MGVPDLLPAGSPAEAPMPTRMNGRWMAAGVVLLVVVGLFLLSDLSQPWGSAQPGDEPRAKLPPLYGLDGRLQDGGVWLENDGPYTSSLPAIPTKLPC